MERSKNEGKSIFKKVKDGLGIVVQVVLAAPVKLPSAFLEGARYVAMLLGLLDALEEGANEDDEEKNKEENNSKTKNIKK